LSKALAIKPKSVFARSWLAWTCWKMGEYEKSLAIHRELLREKPLLAERFFKIHPEIGRKI
jgi:hypothetical protein